MANPVPPLFLFFVFVTFINLDLCKGMIHPARQRVKFMWPAINRRKTYTDVIAYHHRSHNYFC